MTAIQLGPQPDHLVRLYDQPEPQIILSKRTLGAVAAVAVIYVGGGMMLNLMGIDIRIPTIVDPTPVDAISIRMTPPPPQKVDRPIIATPPVVHKTKIEALPDDAATLPIDPTNSNAVDETPMITTTDAVDPTPGPVNSTVTTPPSPPMIRNPDWISKPTPAQMDRLFPTRAAERGLRGAVTMECRVTAQGVMNACTVVTETPKGLGFGDAALASTRYFRMSPRTVDGQPIEGAKVRIPMGFIPAE